jgi:hypothetical protein
VPGLRELHGLPELRLAQHGVILVPVVAETVDLGVEGHHAHEAPDPQPVDEGRVDVGVFLHLEHGRHAAPEELRVGERAHRQALRTRDDRRHREVLAGDAAEPGILRPAPEECVADVVVGAHEAGDDHLAPAVEDARGRRMPADDLVARPHVDDARSLHVDGAGVQDAPPGIDREDRRVADQDAHGGCVDLRSPGLGTGRRARVRSARARHPGRSAGLATAEGDGARSSRARPPGCSHTRRTATDCRP